MGQSLKKLAAGNGVAKEAEIGKIAARTYENMAKDVKGGDWTITDVYRAVCKTVGDLNKELGSTQFCAPNAVALRHAFDKHHKGSSKLTPEEFSKMVKDLVFDTGFKGSGAKDIILYMYGVPITMLFIKNTIMPTAIPNDMFIPAVTSATVYALAKFNKI
ncbi:uncharacterized protein LOC113312254 [Papaver somniferum]|uniref:uncharacterized protein LOC113312254 n=1 Tax=Papaver somniferum TaxID=3469 RepID=UPI000E70363E|nr:uncharacterized protein LOC113312254 [Papaver somniferum]